MPVVNGEIRNDMAIVRASALPAGHSGRAEVERAAVSALLDTGADICGVSRELAKRLGMTPVDSSIVETVLGPVVRNIYKVDIHISIGGRIIAFREQLASEVEAKGPPVIIGMNIIRHGSLHVAKNYFTFAL